MPELIDKKRTEAKVFLIARLFIDRPDREVDLVKAVIHRCCEEIDKQPTIEAEPVRHGRWINVGEETMHDGWTYRKHKCSECGFLTVEAINFCPKCGARMDGKE